MKVSYTANNYKTVPGETVTIELNQLVTQQLDCSQWSYETEGHQALATLEHVAQYIGELTDLLVSKGICTLDEINEILPRPILKDLVKAEE